jgi:hypothetical protein
LRSGENQSGDGNPVIDINRFFSLTPLPAWSELAIVDMAGQTGFNRRLSATRVEQPLAAVRVGLSWCA